MDVVERLKRSVAAKLVLPGPKTISSSSSSSCNGDTVIPLNGYFSTELPVSKVSVKSTRFSSTTKRLVTASVMS